MKLLNALILAISSLALTACDGGQWVDAPMMANDCAALEASKSNAEDAELFDMMAKQTCSENGMSFTGDLQCKDNNVQINCR